MIRHRPSRVAPPPEECPLTACMAILGGAWTPNIVWYLGAGPRRFNVEAIVDVGHRLKQRNAGAASGRAARGGG